MLNSVRMSRHFFTPFYDDKSVLEYNKRHLLSKKRDLNSSVYVLFFWLGINLVILSAESLSKILALAVLPPIGCGVFVGENIANCIKTSKDQIKFTRISATIKQRSFSKIQNTV